MTARDASNKVTGKDGQNRRIRLADDGLHR